MSETRAVSTMARLPWARTLILVGVATTLTSAAVGYVWLQRMPELQPVAFGRQVQITARDSTSATIFASTGLSRPPSCEVASESGDQVTVGDPERYYQGDGLESAFGFPVATGGTYRVRCSSAAEGGRFAVAEDMAVPEGVFIAAGSLGLVMCGLGGLLTARQGRRR